MVFCRMMYSGGSVAEWASSVFNPAEDHSRWVLKEPLVWMILRSNYSLFCPYVISARHFICSFLCKFLCNIADEDFQDSYLTIFWVCSKEGNNLIWYIAVSLN